MNAGKKAFRVRGAVGADLDALHELAGFLDTVNLPHDHEALQALLERSRATFRGELPEPGDRLHLFVLEDVETGRAVGSSMILGQLGTRLAPYVFFERGVEERYSRVLERHFRHETLQIRYVYDGPTELGGLVVHPALRSSPEGLGRQIAFARYAVIAGFPQLFRDQCVAELLPPRRPDGGSDFWDAVGRVFTGLDYAEADRLSRVEKEFIRELFPEATIYLSLLSPKARAPVGKVGPGTEPAKAMLQRIGFRDALRVDPFDGGPHFIAETRAIRPVAKARRAPLRELWTKQRALFTRFLDAPPFFLAVAYHPGDRFEDLARALECDGNAEILAIPLHNR